MRTRRLLQFVVLLVCGVSSVHCAVAAQKQKKPAASLDTKSQLRLSLQKGQVFDQMEQYDRKSIRKNGRQSYETNSQMTAEIRFEVEKVNKDGSYDLQVTYPSVKFSSSASDSPPISYDSTSSKKVPLQAGGAAAFANQTLHITLSPQGEKLKITGADTIANQILDNYNIAGNQRSSLEKPTRERVEEEIQRMLIGIFPFPHDSVSSGDTWQANTGTRSGLPGGILTSFKLDSRSAEEDKISFTSNILANQNLEEQVEGSKGVTYNISGTQAGKLSLSETTGWTKSFDIDQRFNGKIIAPGERLVRPRTRKSRAKIVEKPVTWTVTVTSKISAWTVNPPSSTP